MGDDWGYLKCKTCYCSMCFGEDELMEMSGSDQKNQICHSCKTRMEKDKDDINLTSHFSISRQGFFDLSFGCGNEKTRDEIFKKVSDILNMKNIHGIIFENDGSSLTIINEKTPFEKHVIWSSDYIYTKIYDICFPIEHMSFHLFGKTFKLISEKTKAKLDKMNER